MPNKIGVAVMCLVNERLERNSRVICGEPFRIRSAGNQRTFTNAARDGIGKLLAIRRTLRVLGFGWIGEETTLNQNGRNPRIPQNIESAPTNAAVRSGRDTIDIIVNRRGEP